MTWYVLIRAGNLDTQGYKIVMQNIDSLSHNYELVSHNYVNLRIDNMQVYRMFSVTEMGFFFYLKSEIVNDSKRDSK